MKALDKDRSRRYETANGLAKDVQRYLEGDAVEACPPTLGYRLSKTFRRHRGAILTFRRVRSGADDRHRRQHLAGGSCQACGAARDGCEGRSSLFRVRSCGCQG